MGLRTKFNIMMLAISIIGISISGFVGYNILQENARTEVLEMASILMESAIAVRNYTVNEVKPLLKVQQRRQFISQTVPAYAASRYIKALQTTHADFSYREATLNPTNPANKASDWEADIVNWFRNHDSEKELIGQRETATGQQLYLSRPITVTNPGCLNCHSAPAKAPETLIATYGNSNGFGWKLNETVGAQIVSVPMELPLQRAQTTFKRFILSLIGLFLFIAVSLNLFLHFIVLRPISRLSEKADEISLGDLDVEELSISGKDEIASLGRSFNRMHRSLRNAVEILDESGV